MANRESQGLQISLILFVMVSVVLAVMTFVFYRGSQEAQRLQASAESREQSMRQQYDRENFKVQYLQHVLGAVPLSEPALQTVLAGIPAEDATMQGIRQNFESDMANHGQGLPAEKRNYRELPLYLTLALEKKNAANAELLDRVAQLTQEKEQTVENEGERTQQAQLGLEKALGELEQEHQTYADERKRITREQQEILVKANSTNSDLRKQLEALTQQRNVTQTQLDDAKKTVDNQLERIEQLVDEPFESPDGQVYSVNQQLRIVWINLGTADGLRRQTTFSVYDQEAMNVAPRRDPEEEGGVVRRADIAKGKIEITRMLGPHLAEGRIVEDDPANPIMKGDQVFSPAWKPGRRVRFALAGKMDINNDRRSDRALIRSIITMGGGVVDAEVLDDGQLRGELTGSTRYLVLGEEPIERDVLTAYGQIKEQAGTYGVQEISLSVLLDLMGYKSETRTTTLGRRAGGLREQAAADAAAAGELPEVRRPPAGSAF